MRKSILLVTLLAAHAVSLSAQEPTVVHVFVPLCDNKNQGIVPVPAALGNGQDPGNNLYWGAQFGVRTFFKRSADWKEVECASKPGGAVLCRTVFKATDPQHAVYVVADAYDGAKMKQTLIDFFSAAAGQNGADMEISDGKQKLQIPIAGRATMVCFVGHDGLMDTTVALPEAAAAKQPKWAIVLACKSDAYFSKSLRSLGCKPLLTTTGLMAPEAYVLDASIRSWANGDSPSVIKEKTGAAYARYQKLELSAATRLFTSDSNR